MNQEKERWWEHENMVLFAILSVFILAILLVGIVVVVEQITESNTTDKALDLLIEIKKENPGISDEEAAERVQKIIEKLFSN